MISKDLSRFFYFLLFLLLFSSPALAQESGEELSSEDQEIIKSKAASQMNFLADLMNIVVKKGTEPDELPDFLATAFSPEQRLFTDSLTILEDDIYALRADSLPPKDVSVEKYFNDLYLFYKKSQDANSITFYDFRFSKFKKKNYLYVNLFFLVRYRERHRDFNESYPVRKRIASFRAEKINGEWKASISGITFYRDKKPDGSQISSAEFDQEYKPYVKEKKIIHSSSGNAVDTLTFDNTQRELLRRSDSSYREAVNNQRLAREEERKRELNFTALMSRGDSLAAAGQFRTAIEIYTDARSLKPFDIPARDKVKEIMNLLEGGYETPAEKLKKQKEAASQKFSLRDYEEALQAYQLVLKLSPEDAEAKNRIQELDNILKKWSAIRALYMEGNGKKAGRAFSAEASESKDNPDFFFERARYYLHENEKKKALQDLNKAISLHPGYREALVQRADYFIREGNISSAIADYSSLISIDPENARNHDLKAQAHIAAKDPEAAEKEYDQALKIQPENPHFLCSKADLLRERKSLQDALSLAEKALGIKTNFPSGHFQKGLILLELGDEKAAASSIQKARKLGINQNQVLVLDRMASDMEKKATEAESKETAENAIALLKKSLIFKPNSPATCLKIAELYSKINRAQDALKATDQAIFLKEDYLTAYLMKGRLLMNTGDYKNCLAPFYKAKKFDSRNTDAGMGIGKSFIELQKYDSALVWFADVLKIRPDYPEALLNRGICHFKKENYVRASQDFELALRKDSKLAEAYFYKARVHKAYNRYESAIEDFEKAAELGYNVFNCNIEIGNSFEKLGKTGKAIQFYTKAIAADPEKADAYLLRGMCRLKDEDMKNAMADLDEGLKMDTSLSKAPYQIELGFILLGFENFEKAEVCFHRALSFDRYHPRANFGMGICQFHNGETGLSMRSFEQGFVSKKLDYAEIKKMPAIKKILKNKQFQDLKESYVR